MITLFCSSDARSSMARVSRWYASPTTSAFWNVDERTESCFAYRILLWESMRAWIPERSGVKRVRIVPRVWYGATGNAP